jgi:hypothetical protein
MIDSELIILLSQSDLDNLTKEISDNGYATINDLRQIMQTNLPHDLDFTAADVDIICLFDLRTNYKVFITEHEIMTREELIEKYNLNKFKLEPEQLFNLQKIDINEYDYNIFDEECEKDKKTNKLYSTKIYIGKEKWKDFIIMFRFMRSLSFISETKLTITDSEKNKDFEKNKDSEYIGKIFEQVFNG